MAEEPQKDYLTGFSLRDTLYLFLKKLIADGKLNKKYFSILLIDIDHFKKYNDKFGHLFGDKILEYVADIFPLFFPKNNCFRYGGDEFVVVLTEKDPRKAFYLALQLRHNMAKRPFFFENKSYNPFKITFSCGIATFPSDGQTVVELLKKADEAMYFSKRHGRDLITIAGKMKYITFRNIFLLFLSICTIFIALSTLYIFPFREPIQRIIRDIKDIRITAEQTGLDIIILKNGDVLKGEILEETDQKLVLKMHLMGGVGSLILEKSEIDEIKYGPKRSAK
ncbi:MAG: diguanylate cyclase [Candidatus Omnitrophota bacterium]|nr:MAG: diguanylate cyclase [Candidatus Omnitrophota bacterium]